MIHKVTFENYKAFKEKQELKLKPITVLIGKNSSGKSAVLRLLVMLLESLEGRNTQNEPLVFKTKDFDFAKDFNGLVYKKLPRALKLSVDLDGAMGLESLALTLRYYKELKKGVIEEFNRLEETKEGEITHKFELNSQNITKEEYQYTRSDIACSLLNLSFKGLSYETVFTTKGEEVPLMDINNFPNFLLPSIIYQEPLRPPLESLYHPIEDADSIALLLHNNKELLNDVADWYQDKLGVGRIDTEEIAGGFFELTMQNNGFSTRLMDTGLGIGQSLPIVTHTLNKEDDTLHIIEQPELHLHPAAHGAIAQLMVESVKETPKSRFLVETHSENFILRLRRLVAEGTLSIDDLAIYWVEYDEEKEASTLKEIVVDEMGEVDFWPEGIFSEGFEEVKAIGRAQYERQNKEDKPKTNPS